MRKKKKYISPAIVQDSDTESVVNDHNSSHITSDSANKSFNSTSDSDIDLNDFVLKNCKSSKNMKQLKKTQNKKSTTSLKQFECSQCSYKSDIKSNLKRHTKTHDVVKNTCGTIKCPECPKSFKTYMILDSHLQDVHERLINVESYEFEDETEFQKWRNELCSSKFVKYIKHKFTDSKKVYICNRNGTFHSVSTGGKSGAPRLLKKFGSIKCGTSCSARIEAKLKDGKYLVKHYMNHFSHELNPGKMGLTSPEKRAIAGPLLQGVRPKTVLSKIRKNIQPSLNRVAIINMQDIYNISKLYGVKSDVRLDPDDATSVYKRIQQLKDANDFGVFLYKQQGETGEFPELKEDEFLLAYMNSAQEEMFRTYGKNVVCIDGTHGTNAYNFELTTILTLDNQKQGFPVAFFFHSCKSQVTYEIFFMKLKQRLGTIAVKIFMSDDEPAFYNAWEKVMGPPSKKLLCIWHVFTNWKRKLNGLEASLRESTYEKLRAIAMETEIPTFELAYKLFLQYLESTPLLQNFHRYLVDNYDDKQFQWAYCHRLRTLNTNMYLERLHRDLKHEYLNGKKIRRLDEGFNAVLEMLTDKQFDRVVSICRGKVATKEKLLRRRCKDSQNLNLNSVFDFPDYFLVKSTSNELKTYVVKKVMECKNCLLRCETCKSCFHEYTCECLDNSNMIVMCKHIHLVCRYKNVTQKSVNSTAETVEDDLVIDTNINIESNASEVAVHFNHLFNRSQGLELNLKKEDVKDYFNKVFELIDDESGVKILKDHLRTVRVLLQSKKDPNQIIKFRNYRKIMSNENIEKQRRFTSIKKRNPRKRCHANVNNNEIISSIAPIRIQSALATSSISSPLMSMDSSEQERLGCCVSQATDTSGDICANTFVTNAKVSGSQKPNQYKQKNGMTQKMGTGIMRNKQNQKKRYHVSSPKPALLLQQSSRRAYDHQTSPISPSAAELTEKIQSVKRVWETSPMPSVPEQQPGRVCVSGPDENSYHEPVGSDSKGSDEGNNRDFGPTSLPESAVGSSEGSSPSLSVIAKPEYSSSPSTNNPSKQNQQQPPVSKSQGHIVLCSPFSNYGINPQQHIGANNIGGIPFVTQQQSKVMFASKVVPLDPFGSQFSQYPNAASAQRGPYGHGESVLIRSLEPKYQPMCSQQQHATQNRSSVQGTNHNRGSPGPITSGNTGGGNTGGGADMNSRTNTMMQKNSRKNRNTHHNPIPQQQVHKGSFGPANGGYSDGGITSAYQPQIHIPVDVNMAMFNLGGNYESSELRSGSLTQGPPPPGSAPVQGSSSYYFGSNNNPGCMFLSNTSQSYGLPFTASLKMPGFNSSGSAASDSASNLASQRLRPGEPCSFIQPGLESLPQNAHDFMMNQPRWNSSDYKVKQGVHWSAPGPIQRPIYNTSSAGPVGMASMVHSSSHFMPANIDGPPGCVGVKPNNSSNDSMTNP